MNVRYSPWMSSMVAGALLLSAGCDESVQVGPRTIGPTGPVAPQPQTADEVDAGAVGEAAAGFRDEDFTEAETSRDPFRSFVEMFQRRPVEAPQRTVIMPTTALEQMQLIAIISGVPRPRAMLVDPMSVGHVVERGDFIGRAEVVQAGGTDGVPVTLNWRVDRIRPNEVVLSREDPTAPNRPPLTHVIPLRDEPELTR